MSDHDDDDDDDSSSSYSYISGFGSIFDSLRFTGYGSVRAMTPAGQMMASAKAADAKIKEEADITDDVHAALRRCQIRSMWPTWDHKADTP